MENVSTWPLHEGVHDLGDVLTMVTIEGIVKVDRTRFTWIFPTRFNREISGTHGSLSHVVDAMEEVSFVIVGLRQVRRVCQDCRKDLAHYVLRCAVKNQS